jgi:hypothetical protein
MKSARIVTGAEHLADLTHAPQPPLATLPQMRELLAYAAIWEGAMTLREDQRFVSICNIYVESVPQWANSLPLADLCIYLEDIFKLKQTTSVEAGGQMMLAIADIQYDSRGKNITFLFRHGDKKIVNPAFVAFDTQKVREEKKRKNEGMAYSAHLSISLEPFSSNPNRYRAVLERIPSLSRTVILDFLNRLLRNYAQSHSSQFTFTDPETHKQKQFHPKLSCYLEQSETLKKDLKEGELSHLELVKREYQEPEYDEHGWTKVTARDLKLKVVARKSGRGALELIEKIKQLGAAQDYNILKVTYKRPAGETTQNVTAPIAIEEENAVDFLYARLHVIQDFSTPLGQSPEVIHSEMRDKLLELLSDNNLWSAR